MEKEIPVANEINLRDNPKSNKFIQLYVNNKPYLRFIRPSDVRYHFDILANTLMDEFGMGFKSEREIPKKKGERYEMVGAGIFEKIDDKKVRLYGASRDYLIGPNKEHADKISELTGLEFILS